MSIYLDYAASTPVRPEVLEAMLPYFTTGFGNASSLHAYGREAKLALSASRDAMAAALGCKPSELVFTSGGTESDNLALFGAIAGSSAGPGKKHIVTTQIEHHAVLHACGQLEQRGVEVTYVAPDKQGYVDVTRIEAALQPHTVLISVMLANNEVGTIQPVQEIGELARKRGITFHVDAVQALATEQLDLSILPVDLMSFSAHKIGGPKGIGLLYASGKQRIASQLFGGSQERGRRAGTENIPAIVGFAQALTMAKQQQKGHRAHLEELRHTMLSLLEDKLPSSAFIVNGHPVMRIPHILNISFPGVSTETMLMNLDLAGVCAASGSACSSGSLETSHVLRSMGLSEEIAGSAIRFSFGFDTTREEIVTTAHTTATILERLRSRL
ncbi:cysteine desulfurase family protein [Paenibacillus sp. y28]|uniref:cysteine desulfurase family protein n=1 Tax=Paenibacillus sp. y28 TaxID=3129110 RepID=UPI003018FBDB